MMGFLPEYISIKEICQHLGISRSTVYYQMRNGDFPKQVKFGKSARWERQSVLSWIDQQKQATPPQGVRH